MSLIEDPDLTLRNIFGFILILFFTFKLLIAQNNSPPSEAFGDHLIIGYVGSPPSSIDPFRINNAAEEQIARLIFGSGLIQQPNRFSQSPALVDVIRYPESGKSQGLIWSYVIKRNINYQNGIPLRNSDVRFTFELLKRWGGHILNHQIDFSNIKAIEVGGDLEVRFILKQKDKSFDEKFSDIPILSENYYKAIMQTGYDEFESVQPLGYGPFRYSRSKHDEIDLVSHPHYVFGRPFLNQISYKFFDDEQQMVDDFIQGNIDLIEIKDRITAQRVHQILKNDIKIFTTPRPEKKVYYLLFNINRFPFQNLKLRVAIRGAVNPNEIIARLVDQNGHIAYSFVDYTNPQFFKQLMGESYQPEISMQILKNNGWQIERSRGILQKDSKELGFELLFEQNSHLEESIARAIKIHLSELGINVRPKPVNFYEKQQLIDRNQFSAAISSFSYYEDDLFTAAKSFYQDILRKNSANVNYSNPTLDRLFEGSEINRTLRDKTVQRMEIALYQDAPVAFIYFDDKIIYAIKNRFQNIRVTYSSGRTFYHRLNPFENWFVPKALQKYPVW